MKSQDTVHELYLKTEQLLFFRLAFAGVALILAGGLQWFDRGEMYIWPAIRVILAIFGYSSIALALLKWRVIARESAMSWLNGTLISSC